MSNNLTFAQKVRRGEKVVLYEILPPPKNLSKADLQISFSLFAQILKNNPIDGVNLPEVREETRSGKRSTPELIKLEPRAVCSYLQKQGISNLIVNRPVVYLPWEKQITWLKETYNKYNIYNFVLVGGESSKVSYPGPTVIEAARLITNKLRSEFPKMFLGGITIPSRTNEAERVLTKTLAGIEFFTSQVIYDSTDIKRLLKEYWQLCRRKNIKPKMIFLSFAPATTLGDIELLRWLGVEIPQNTLKRLTAGWLGLGWRSIETCQDVFKDILDFVKTNAIGVPLGLNVGHINKHNFELSFILLKKLLKYYLL